MEVYGYKLLHDEKYVKSFQYKEDESIQVICSADKVEFSCTISEYGIAEICMTCSELSDQYDYVDPQDSKFKDAISKIVRNKLKNVTEKLFDPYLKELGFRKNNKSYFKKIGEYGWLLEISNRRSDPSYEKHYALNLNLFWEGHYLNSAVKDIVPEFPKSQNCFIRNCQSPLNNFEHINFYINWRTDETQIINQIESFTKNVLIPLLSDTLTKESIEEIIESEKLDTRMEKYVDYLILNNQKEKAINLLQKRVNSNFLPKLWVNKNDQDQNNRYLKWQKTRLERIKKS